VEQAVVERRRAVLAQDPGDVGERAVGDAHRQPLVDPVADVELGVLDAEAERDEQAEADRHEHPRGRERPDPRRPRRA